MILQLTQLPHTHSFGWFRQLSHIFLPARADPSIYEAIFGESDTLIIFLPASDRPLSRLIMTCSEPWADMKQKADSPKTTTGLTNL